MQQKHSPSFRQRLAGAILGRRAKDFIPALNPFEGVSFGGVGRVNNYSNKLDQMQANIGWSHVANTAIADTCAAVPYKLYRKKKDGDREEITDHPILDLLDSPNFAHTGEQLKQLHFTYMNFVGESYIYMIANGGPFEPGRGKLPQALQILPGHEVQFKLGETYNESIVKLGNHEYPITSVIRDINPDPNNLYFGRSVIAAAAVAIDTENQMKEWNRGVFKNGGRPSSVITSTVDMNEATFNRLKEEFSDEHTGTENANRPIILGNADIKPYMLSQQDLDFLKSREFSRDEILAMWRVNPYMIGSVEDVNLATARAARTQHAEINVVPRLRQFVKQLNSTLVSVFDPMLELDFDNPVPEDIDAKREYVEGAVNRSITADEARALYGMEPLPNGLGTHIVITGKGAPVTLDAVVSGETLPSTTQPAGASKSLALRAKQVSINDFPGLLDDVDMIPEEPGCIMLDTETLSVTEHVQDGEDDLLAGDDVHARGAVAERTAHVTLLYGLLENGNVWKSKVDTVLKDWTMPDVTVDKVGSFDLGDSHAIVAHIKQTPALVDGHERLTLLPHVQTHSEYMPHLTLAYVEHDQAVADKWVKALGKQYNGKTLKATGINYGDQPESANSKSLTGVKKKL